MVGSGWAGTPPEDADNPSADPEQVARTILLRRLEAAPRTRAQLATTLRERLVPDDVAHKVLDRFEEVGLINDRLFAEMWVESRQRTRNLSSRALRNELRLKGIPDEFIVEALAGVSHEDELAGARKIAAQKARSVAGLPRVTQVRRLSGALARKGYGAGIASQVVREVLDEADDNADTSGRGFDAPS